MVPNRFSRTCCGPDVAEPSPVRYSVRYNLYGGEGWGQALKCSSAFYFFYYTCSSIVGKTHIDKGMISKQKTKKNTCF